MSAADIELDFNIKQVCRICLSASNSLSNIYTNTVVDGYIVSISEVIFFCLDVSVDQEDCLPNKLCDVCKSDLTKFYILKKKSKRTQQVLQDMIPAAPKKRTKSPITIVISSSPPPKKLKLETEKPQQMSDKEEEECIITDQELQYHCEHCNLSFKTKKILDKHSAKIHSDKKIVKNEEHLREEELLMTIPTTNVESIEKQLEEMHEEILGDNDGDDGYYYVSEEEIDQEEITDLIQTSDEVSSQGNIVSTSDYIHTNDGNDGDDNDDYGELVMSVGEIKPVTSLFCPICDEYCKDQDFMETHLLECHEGYEMYSCELCGKQFSNETDINRHLKLFHLTANKKKDDDEQQAIKGPYDGESGADDYECHLCGEVFDLISDFREHWKLHECEECGELFSNYEELNRHKHSAHTVVESRTRRPKPSTSGGGGDGDDIELPCTHCKRKYKSRVQFDQHIKMHESMNMVTKFLDFFPCHKCRIIYLLESDLNGHMDLVHKIQPSSDQFVDESCTDYQFLDEDERGQMYEEGEYSCGICETVCASANDQKYHIIMHSKRLTCPFDGCGCQYDMFSRFTMHIMNKHVNGQFHQCNHCSMEFNTFDDLQSHSKNSCEERKFACTHCDKKFFSKKALQHHIKNAQGKTFACQFCGKKFSQQGELTIHNRTHTGERPFICTICNKAYKTSSMRSAHMDAHIKGKTFECTMCDKKLQTRTSYRNHVRRHTEEKKHECKHCGKKFFTKYHVKLHILKIHDKSSGDSESTELEPNVTIITP